MRDSREDAKARSSNGRAQSMGYAGHHTDLNGSDQKPFKSTQLRVFAPSRETSTVL